MSCNGCRVLRKGCSERCTLRPCLQWIESPEAQGHATLFVAKFFGRAGLMSFISSVPETERSALFQSLFFEACGRTVNPVHGAVGLLWTGNWHVCQAAVETVLRGGTLQPMSELLVFESDDLSKADLPSAKRKRFDELLKSSPPSTLDLRLSPTYLAKTENQRSGSPSLSSEESVTTTTSLCHQQDSHLSEVKLLNLFI